ncbi:MAG: DUF4430 domain-containing protein [archaeon]|nr:DUF4430 domain-containing protein [archaeon]
MNRAKLSILLIIVLLFFFACVQQTQNTSTGLVAGVLDNSIDSSINSSDTSNSKQFVQLVVSKNFGNEILLKEKIEIEEKTSALDTLKSAASVQTKYGEGFVDSINGISSEFSSGKKLDWFFFINGFSPNFAANQYFLKAGDKVQFDLHDWSYQLHIPAYSGEFPQPLLNGFQDKKFATAVVFSPEFEESAKQFQEFLLDDYSIESELVEISQITEQQKKSHNLIIITSLNNSLIQEINFNHKRNGLFLFFEQEKLIELNSAGENVNSFSDASAFFAVSSPWNEKGSLAQENIVYVFTGTSKEQTSKLIEEIINNPSKINNFFSIIFENNNLKGVPA